MGGYVTVLHVLTQYQQYTSAVFPLAAGADPGFLPGRAPRFGWTYMGWVVSKYTKTD